MLFVQHGSALRLGTAAVSLMQALSTAQATRGPSLQAAWHPSAGE